MKPRPIARPRDGRTAEFEALPCGFQALSSGRACDLLVLAIPSSTTCAYREGEEGEREDQKGGPIGTKCKEVRCIASSVGLLRQRLAGPECCALGEFCQCGILQRVAAQIDGRDPT